MESTSSTSECLPLDRLIVDLGVHGRARVNQGVVRRYAQVAGSSADKNHFEAVDVFRDSEGKLWVADGFLRCYGSRAAGHASIQANLHQGQRRDAVLFACGANAKHGKPRSREDLRASTAALLMAPEFADESDASIANRVGVSRALVAELRPHCGSQDQYYDYVDRCRREKWLKKDAPRIAATPGHRLYQHARSALARQGLPVPPEPEETSVDCGAGVPPAELRDELPAGGTPAPQGETPSQSPREQALQLLARAAAAAARAKRAMVEAQKAYPEANHFPAVVAVVEAQAALEDLQPEERKTPPVTGVDPREVLAAIDQVVGTGPDTRGVAMTPYAVLPDPYPAPKTIFDQESPRATQPETLRPEAKGKRGGRGGARSKQHQPETLHPSGRGPTISDWLAERAQRGRAPPFG